MEVADGAPTRLMVRASQCIMSSYLVWEGSLHGDSLGKIISVAVKGWARLCSPKRLPSLND